jgi:hypothetical protein
MISARKKLILQQSGMEVFATKLYTHMPVTFVTIEKGEEKGIIGPKEVIRTFSSGMHCAFRA